jgi:hypothetical protein
VLKIGYTGYTSIDYPLKKGNMNDKHRIFVGVLFSDNAISNILTNCAASLLCSELCPDRVPAR